MVFNVLKILGLIASGLGIGAEVLSGFVKDKEMKKAVKETVDEALNERIGINNEKTEDEDENEEES